MNLSILKSRAEVGVAAPEIQVEVHIAGGLPGLTIVGLPTTAVREARDRVRAALQSSGFKIPPRRITVNLAPAELPKDSARFDLAIALGILQASGQLNVDLSNWEFLGELSLSGELRGIGGVIPAVLASQDAGSKLLVPAINATEAILPGHPAVHMAASLGQACAALSGETQWCDPPNKAEVLSEQRLDLQDVRGQQQAKRALEIAAAGRHDLIMVGPPGSGKSMLAARLPGLCPPLAREQALQIAAIRSSAGEAIDWAAWNLPPFRTPHHNASSVAIVGGGSRPRPGEISLAHHGILFLDELPEFQRPVLEALREPMETGSICLSRAQQRISYPAKFQLLASLNPCPCGYLGDPSGRCHCSADAVSRYQSKVSGPIWDRIDLQIQVPRLPSEQLIGQKDPDQGDSSQHVAQRVADARQRQLARRGKLNRELTVSELEVDCALNAATSQLLEQAANALLMSGRAIHRVLKVARTIADLADSGPIEQAHLAEALQYRARPTLL